MKMEEIGQTIRKVRKVSGMTQLELAQLAGVGKASVFDVEKGKETVQLKTIMLIFNALNITLTVQTPMDDYDEKS